MPKAIDIRDNDTTPVQEIIISDELSLIGFHEPHYHCCELSYNDGEHEISLPFDEIDDFIKALRMVKQIRGDMGA